MMLDGRVALLTGGRRIGGVVAEALAAGGADVALVYHRQPDAVDDSARAIRATGRRAITIHADLSDAVACERVVAETVSGLGRLDVLVNMASIYRSIPFDALTATDWDSQLAVDLRATLLCAKAAVPAMRQQGGGRIVNFADWIAASGRPRYPGFLAYYVAKAGVIALSEGLALELAPDQILVNTVAPGPIEPPPGMSADEHEGVVRATPLGRWGGADEIAKTVRFLVESDFVTGETIRVDGGRHIR